MTTAAPKPLCNERWKCWRKLESQYLNCIWNLSFLALFMNSKDKPPTKLRPSERLSDLDSYREGAGCFIPVIAAALVLVAILFSIKFK